MADMRADPGDQRLHAARRLVEAGDTAGASRALRQILALDPNHIEALRLLAGAMTAAGRHADAVAALRRALDAAPAHPRVLVDLAGLVDLEGRHDEADRLLQRALAAAPGDAGAIGARAEWLVGAGRLDEARALLEDAGCASGRPIAPWLAIPWARVAELSGRPLDGAEALAPLARDARVAPIARRSILLRVAHLLDAGARHDEAFAAAREAKALPPAQGRPAFDPILHRRSIDLLIQRWTPEAIARLPIGDADATPVFIVGVPRSGTSLVEQILASHPGVHGADERPEITMIGERLAGAELPTDVAHFHRLDALTPDMAARAAAAYLEVMRSLNPGAQRITDKRPDNFLHLGLISRLFPRAKVIHIARNPLDVTVSCYFRDFYGPCAWADDLDHIGVYIEEERRLMRHWGAVLDLDILSLRYEGLVDAPTAEIQRLVGHIGLPWDDACLRFHESKRIARTASVDQVRRPIHRAAVERWRNYEAHLGALVERFAGEVGA